MKRFFTGLLLLTAFVSAPCLHAEGRIAAVDLDRVFREYYKSRIAEQFIGQRAESARTYMGQLNGELTKLREEAQRLGTNALNPGLNGQEREKARKSAEDALARLRSKEAEIKLYTANAGKELRELESRRRAEIVADIRAELSRRATAEGYTYVFDSSGKTMNEQPALLVFPQSHDITDSVIRELNRTAAKIKPQASK